MQEQSLSFLPNAKVVRQVQEPRINSITSPPREITPPNQEHLNRHWQPVDTAKDSPAFLGSRFEPNDAFKEIGSLTKFLQDTASELIPLDQHDRRHVVTISFPYPIGRTAVVELSESDKPVKAIREKGAPGEATVNTVIREDLPETNLLTFDVKPIFPPKGSKGLPVTFQISSAFPGEPAPRLITKARIENHTRKPESDPQFDLDKQYWDNHAFVTKQIN